MTTTSFTRRDILSRIGGGFGLLGLTSVFADAGLLRASAPSTNNNPLAPRPPHFTPRAKRVIFLFMNGGPSHVDTFDPKPALAKYAGKPLPETCGAIVAGIVLGFMSLKTRSIWLGAAIHMSVALSMDFLSMWRKGLFE